MTSNTGNNEPGRLLIQDVLGTKYPYITVGTGSVGTVLANWRRSIASVNPFAFPQIPSQDRLAFGIRRGNGWYNPLPYPNSIVWSRMFPAHYDPLKEEPRQERWQLENFSPNPHSNYGFTADKLPRGCIRQLQNYKRCELINSAESCQEESNNIIRICPTWALDEMKEKRRFLLKVQAINRQQYENALEVSDYNKGRSVKDISDRTWIDGTRERLRPDTLWADERYTKITQAEINEAKKRIEDRKARGKSALHTAHETVHSEGPGSEDHHAHDHHDYTVAQIKKPVPLYP